MVYLGPCYGRRGALAFVALLLLMRWPEVLYWLDRLILTVLAYLGLLV